MGWELPVHTRRTRYLETLIWVLFSLAQGVRLKGTGGRASDRHSRSESIARLDWRTDGGTERGLPWPFSRFLTHPLPKSFFFLSFTRFGLVFNKIRCSLYLLPSLRCDHSFITVNLSLSLSLSLPQAAICYQFLILQMFVREFCCVWHGAKSLWKFVEVCGSFYSHVHQERTFCFVCSRDLTSFSATFGLLCVCCRR